MDILKKLGMTGFSRPQELRFLRSVHLALAASVISSSLYIPKHEALKDVRRSFAKPLSKARLSQFAPFAGIRRHSHAQPLSGSLCRKRRSTAAPLFFCRQAGAGK